MSCRSTILAAVIAATCSAVITSHAIADEIGDRLTAAKAERSKSIESESATLRAVFDDAVKTMAATGNLNDTKDLIAQKEAYQSAGTLPSASTLKAGVEKYIVGRRAASAKLVRAYREAVSEYTKKLEIDKATAVQNAMEAFIAEEKTFFSTVSGGAAKDDKQQKSFFSRDVHRRETMLTRHGGNQDSERSVAAALKWLSRHQNKDGSWSITRFNSQCRQGKCDGAGTAESDAAATAFSLLPFLAAGQTHNTQGDSQKNIRAGINWLMQKQKPNGNLSAGSGHVMYTHGLATIAMCEAYALSKDKRVGQSAQAAINFIQAAQDQNGGGWRYHPGEAGDTSVVGWQVMALKSGQLAELKVSPDVLDRAKRFLTMASGNELGWKFGYTGPGPTPTMAGVGLLCRQHLGAAKDDPGLAEGAKYLMANLPDDKGNRSIYYWYYATQVIYNLQGEDWETWNRKMRDILVNTQDAGKDCSTGSWSPTRPSPDAWGNHGGRLMTTSLSCLCLEIYYRYSPLYDNNKLVFKDDDKSRP